MEYYGKQFSGTFQAEIAPGEDILSLESWHFGTRIYYSNRNRYQCKEN
jgi:hypothetical protein